MASFAESPAVQVRATTMTIPTYPLGPENPNPPFRLVNPNNIYPYTELDTLTDQKQPKTYKAIVLENRYLKAMVIPSLGARLYSLYDKTDKREVFYRNHVVKYALIGLRGAWINGGIEFSFPNAHTTDSVSLVSARSEHNLDGSASILLGDVDRVSDMYWQVRLTLRPDQRRLEEQVTLYNPNPSPELYWWWDNSAVRSTPDLHFMYPMREVDPDSRTERWSYPIWKGVDYSKAFNYRHPTEIFAIHVHRDYFGGYYQDENVGMVHVANYRKEEGKKIWSWGVGGVGKMWTRILTDHDGPYNELQAGVFQTQLNQDFFPPRHRVSFTEYWYPVDHLNGGYVDASRDFALNEKTTGNEAELEIESTIPVRDAVLTVASGGKTVEEKKNLAFEPASTQNFHVGLPVAGEPITVDLISSTGKTLLHWDSSAPIDGNPNFVSQVGKTQTGRPHSERHRVPESVQRTFLQARMLQMEGKQIDALKIFQRILEQDPGYIPALQKCALLSYRGADFSKAEDYIGRAVKEKHSDPRSQYIAGVVDRAAAVGLDGDALRKQEMKAEDAFWAAIRYGGPRGPAYAQLGQIALARKDYAQAEKLLRKALQYNPHDALSSIDLAETLRLSGNLDKASDLAGKTAKRMQLYPAALAEQWRVASQRTSGAESAKQEWMSSVGNRDESYLDAGSWYWRNRDWPASEFILKAAISHLPPQKISPMVYYYLASDARQQGHKSEATGYEKQAQAAEYQRIFPNRLSDEQVLHESVQQNPGDGLAKYLLGTYLFQYARYTEAEELWSQAEQAGFHYAVLNRDRGLYQWRVRHQPAQAAGFYQKAIHLAPDDYHLYVDLDQIYGQMGDQAKRQQLFGSAPASVLNQDTARARYILLLVEEKQYDEALAMLKDHVFHPWELGMNIRRLFVAANIEQGRALLAAGKAKQAQASFEQALEYPGNLMVGKPDHPDESQQLYWIGEAQSAQGNKTAAEATWRKAVKDGSGHGMLAKYYAGLSLERLGEKAKADEGITRLQSRLNQDFGSNCYYAGLIEIYRGRPGRARAEFERALYLDPSYWPAELELNRSREAGGFTQKKEPSSK